MSIQLHHDLTSPSASIVAHLEATLPPGAKVSYIFCRFDDEESRKAKVIVGTILRQLLSCIPADHLAGLKADIEPMSFIEVLESSPLSIGLIFIVLDGLDECESAVIRYVGTFIHHLLESRCDARVLWSSRPNIIPWLPEELQAQARIDIETIASQQRVASDIQEYIRVTLMQSLEGETPRMRIMDPTLIVTIQDRLEAGAKGMYALLDIRSTQQLADLLL